MIMFKKIGDLVERIWWYFTPYMEISVRWPSGYIEVDHNDPRWCDLGGAVWVKLESADPNDFYRPYMEEWIGRQGWDWAWYMGNTDAAENRLTIRMREKHAVFATHIAMMWS